MSDLEAPWQLSLSAFFLPAFSSVFHAYLSSSLSKSQDSFFIQQMKATQIQKYLLHYLSKQEVQSKQLPKLRNNRDISLAEELPKVFL